MAGRRSPSGKGSDLAGVVAEVGAGAARRQGRRRGHRVHRATCAARPSSSSCPPTSVDRASLRRCRGRSQARLYRRGHDGVRRGARRFALQPGDTVAGRGCSGRTWRSDCGAAGDAGPGRPCWASPGRERRVARGARRGSGQLRCLTWRSDSGERRRTAESTRSSTSSAAATSRLAVSELGIGASSVSTRSPTSRPSSASGSRPRATPPPRRRSFSRELAGLVAAR